MVPLSVLDLAPIVEGSTAAVAFARSLELARHVERLGFQRFWLAEHHNFPGVASAATAVIIAHIAAGTSTIRVGAGGVMLPNHAPLVIAEQFGTLESLAPGRIDLGIGRAPGTDGITAHALRRGLEGAEGFPDDVVELLAYFEPAEPGQRIVAVPGAGLRVPVWILGSSLYGAELAAVLGLPYAFASHFAPAQLVPAIERYRSLFRPSERLAAPRVMVGANVFAADTRAEALRLSLSMREAFVSLWRGRPTQLKPPNPAFDETLTPRERAMIDETLSCTLIGAVDDIRAGLADFVKRTGADEVIVASQIHDHGARLHSYELLAQAART